MDRLITALLRRLPDRLLEAVNAVSFNLLHQRELIIWEDTNPRARWRYFTVRRNTVPTTPTTSSRAMRTPKAQNLLLLALVSLLLGLFLGRRVLGCHFGIISPQSPSQPTPTQRITPTPTNSKPLDFGFDSDSPKTPTPPTTKPTPAKSGAHPSPH